jgi:hypothetical protein
MTKQKDTYEIWLAEQSSQSSQQGGDQQQEQKRDPGTAAVKVRVHKDGGITARVGVDDNAVRFSTHEDGAKIKYGKKHWVVVTDNDLFGDDWARPYPRRQQVKEHWQMAGTQDFEVLDPKAKDIGGVKVVTASGKRMVSLTRAQAQ